MYAANLQIVTAASECLSLYRREQRPELEDDLWLPRWCMQILAAGGQTPAIGCCPACMKYAALRSAAGASFHPLLAGEIIEAAATKV